jgi:uncharacterized protein YcbX
MRGVSGNLTGLYLYPLKAAAAVELDHGQVDEFGLAGDRRWALIRPGGRVITQRDHAKLATVRSRPVAAGLEVQTPGCTPLTVPEPDEDATEVEVRVWGDVCHGRVARRAAAWFSEFLGEACSLVFMPRQEIRPVSARYGRPGDRVSFADGFPFLLVGEGSLTDLNSRTSVPIPADRFRPNLVVSATKPFEEDRWDRIRIGECTFRVVKPCGRCAVTTVDQTTGEKGDEPLRALSGYRKRDGRVLFGQNVIHDGTGTLRLGDEVEVLSLNSGG